MKTFVDIIMTPAELESRLGAYLAGSVCVVFDVLRATSTMVTALHQGARQVTVVGEIAEALAIRQRDPNVILAGERGGQRILATQTGGTDFELGNSPREFTPEIVGGRCVVMTTTNGTRALRSCANAEQLFAGSFLNLEATAGQLIALNPRRVLLVCAGTADEASYEDTLAAGALCAQLPGAWLESASDACLMAMELHGHCASTLEIAMARSRNGRRLSSNPALREDVRFCAQTNLFDCAVRLRDGVATLNR